MCMGAGGKRAFAGAVEDNHPGLCSVGLGQLLSEAVCTNSFGVPWCSGPLPSGLSVF